MVSRKRSDSDFPKDAWEFKIWIRGQGICVGRGGQLMAPKNVKRHEEGKKEGCFKCDQMCEILLGGDVR